MTLIVEDGTGLANAESYASVAAYRAYCDARGTSYADRTDPQIEQDLRKGTDYLGATYRTRWAGFRVTMTQALDWPRYNVPMRDAPGGVGRNYAYYLPTVIPSDIARACIVMAIKAKAGELTPDLTQAVKSKQVGPVKIEYQDYSAATKTYRGVDDLLSAYLAAAGGVRILRG